MGVVTAITGWLFASSPLVDASRRRLNGIDGWAWPVRRARSARPSCRRVYTCHRSDSAFAYRFTLFVTALLVAITGHLGGTLVWGARFFQP